jgi:hypothetical protein
LHLLSPPLRSLFVSTRGPPRPRLSR